MLLFFRILIAYLTNTKQKELQKANRKKKLIHSILSDILAIHKIYPKSLTEWKKALIPTFLYPPERKDTIHITVYVSQLLHKATRSIRTNTKLSRFKGPLKMNRTL